MWYIIHTLAGKNPAPPGMYKNPYILINWRRICSIDSMQRFPPKSAILSDIWIFNHHLKPFKLQFNVLMPLHVECAAMGTMHKTNVYSNWKTSFKLFFLTSWIYFRFFHVGNGLPLWWLKMMIYGKLLIDLISSWPKAMQAVVPADVDAADGSKSTTDLARSWEGVAELRRRSQQHQLVPGTYMV